MKDVWKRFHIWRHYIVLTLYCQTLFSTAKSIHAPMPRSMCWWEGTYRKRANVGDSIPFNFVEVVEQLNDFLMPLLEAIRMAELFSKSWSNNRWQ